MLRRCFFTVSVLMPSREAICLFKAPSAISVSISVSRGVMCPFENGVAVGLDCDAGCGLVMKSERMLLY